MIPTAGGAWQEQIASFLCGRDQRWRHPRWEFDHGCQRKSLRHKPLREASKSTGCEGGPGSAGCGTIFELSSADGQLDRNNYLRIYQCQRRWILSGSRTRSKTPWGIFTAPPCTEALPSRRLRHSVQAGSRHRRPVDGERSLQLYRHRRRPGGWPYSNLILDTAGNLYGTASYGGKRRIRHGVLRSRREPGDFEFCRVNLYALIWQLAMPRFSRYCWW